MRECLPGPGRAAEHQRVSALRIKLQRMVQITRLHIQIAGAQTEIDMRLLAFDHQGSRAGETGCQRLCAAHAA